MPLSRSAPLRRTTRRWLAALLVTACSGETARDHIYLSKPPAVVRPAVPVRSAPVAEPPLGSGATARIVSVRRAATGAPVSLEHVRESIELLALASHGRTLESTDAARLELALSGPLDTVQVLPLFAPVPVVVTHVFRIEAGPGSGLRAGRYEARARFLGEDGRVMAESIPVTLLVRP